MTKLAQLQNRHPTLTFRSAADLNNLDSGFHQDNLRGGLMALPSSTDEVSAILQSTSSLGISVVPHGGRTGLSGAASSSPDQLILDTSKLNRIIEVNALAGTAIVEAGVTLQALEDAAAAHSLTCGIDLAARGSATVGGMVSTNAGGIEAFRNGVMRHRVLGLEAVLADGRIFSDMRRVTKANEGYDLKQLFIGAEGTLGIITAVVVSLTPQPSHADTTIVSCNSIEDAVRSFRFLHNNPTTTLLSAEILWPDYAHCVARALSLEQVLAFEPNQDSLFVIFETAQALGNTWNTPDNSHDNEMESLLETLFNKEYISNAVIASNDRQRNDIWRIREDTFVVDSEYPGGLWFDISVPLDQLTGYVDTLLPRVRSLSPDLRVFLLGHLGDGNLHATIAAKDPITHLAAPISDAMYQGLSQIGGSFSAEHGIGIEKRQALTTFVSSDTIALMKDIKNLLDPKNQMNPGKIL